MNDKMAARYIEAVERENARTAAYTELLAAQQAQDAARVAAAQAAVDKIDGDGDY